MAHTKIIGEQVLLEPLHKKHITEYLKIFSPAVQKRLRVKTISSEQKYLEQALRSDTFFYVIKEQQTEKIVGAIQIREPGYRSQLYCWLNERWWGSGYFQHAMQLAAATYFAQTNETIIAARVDCDNIRSLQALQKVGFACHGIAQGSTYKQFCLVLKKRWIHNLFLFFVSTLFV